MKKEYRHLSSKFLARCNKLLKVQDLKINLKMKMNFMNDNN